MYQRALQGYEKTLGPKAVKKYIPTLNTMENLINLLKETDRIKKSEELYLHAISRIEAIFGRSNNRFQDIQTTLDTPYDND